VADNKDDKLPISPLNPSVGGVEEEISSGKELSTLSPKQETPNMETHAHELHKDPGTGWKHYVFEFFMLFFAVFCGFLMENIREEKLEKNRARQLAGSFYQELKDDSVGVQRAVTNWHRKDSAIEYVKTYFEDSSLENCSKWFAINFITAFHLVAPTMFAPRDVILEQLKNSGSLRYFKSNEFQRLTGDLRVAIDEIRNRDEIEFRYIDQHMTPFLIKHTDYKFYEKLKKFGSLTEFLRAHPGILDSIPFHFNNVSDFQKIETLNMFTVFQQISTGSRVNQYEKYININRRLLANLRDNYDLGRPN
jgi:hypothetical protein